MPPATPEEKVQSLTSVPLALPRVKNIKMLQHLQSIEEMTEESIPIAETLVGDLIVTYALDLDASYVSISRGICKKYQLNPDTVPDLALSNAAELLRDIKVHSDGKLYELEVGHNMAACTILFPSLWNQIAGILNSELVAIFPHTNHVFYAPLHSEQGIQALLEMVQQFDFANDRHTLSQKLYKFHEDEWQEYQVATN